MKNGISHGIARPDFKIVLDDGVEEIKESAHLRAIEAMKFNGEKPKSDSRDLHSRSKSVANSLSLNSLYYRLTMTL